MQTLLLMGFEPFDQDPVNPSWEAVRQLDGMLLGEDVQIAVRDNGPGLPAEVKANVFERFSARNQGGKRAGSGCEGAAPCSSCAWSPRVRSMSMAISATPTTMAMTRVRP